MSEKTTLGENGIYDARSLGVPKMLLLGLQHNAELSAPSAIGAIAA